MEVSSTTWDALAASVNQYEDGDFLAVASWIGFLDQLAQEWQDERRDRVHRLSERLRDAVRKGSLEGVVVWMASELDELTSSPELPVPETTDLWSVHGPAFVAETRSRLGRAEELTLLLEQNADPELVAELFRVFHTIKGEAGFLHRGDLSGLAHHTEELLESVRSGKTAWDGSLADRVLSGIDALKQAVAGPQASMQRPEEILRVPVSKIDALISQIGELLVAQDDGGQQAVVRKLGRALQQSALRLRTEPLADLMNRLKRGARDLARELDKPLEVRLAGGELELDRALISALEEPLMHLLRNALDHGLEPVKERTARGKPLEGTLSIAASRRGNQIVIEVADDGKGLDTEKIWAKGLKLGLVSGTRPTDSRAVHELIFKPGFSTADTLSEVSGRGVGMDIVASSVRRARGRLEVSSEPGQGTRVLMSFPLSTAVVDALVVGLDERRFLVPVHSVRESIPIREDQVTTLASGARVFSLRGEPLRVLSLRKLLDQTEAPAPWGVVTATSDGERQVLLVDRVEAKKEAVIRSLGPLFRNLRGVSAAAVLAGGAPALVLDVDQLVELARIP